MFTWEKKKKNLEKLLYRANASPTVEGWNKLSKEETLEDEEEAAGNSREQKWHVKMHDNEEK